MARAVVTHQGKMVFEGMSGSGHQVVMDSSPEAGGTDRGVRPMEMLLLGLGGCTGIDVVSMLNKMRVPFERFEMAIEGDRVETHPKIYKNITIRYQFTGPDIAPDKIIRAVTLSQEKYCSVSAVLAASAHIDAEIEINGEVIERLQHGGA